MISLSLIWVMLRRALICVCVCVQVHSPCALVRCCSLGLKASKMCLPVMKFILYNSVASALLGVKTGWINLWYKIPKSRQHKCTAFSPHSVKLFISKRNNPNSKPKKSETWSINHLQLLALYLIKSYKPKKLRCKFQINKLLDIMINKMFLVTSRQWDMSINLYLRINQWMYTGYERGKKAKAADI